MLLVNGFLGTSSLHHKMCVPKGPTLGKSYRITYQKKGARATQALDKFIVQRIVVV